MPQFRAVRALSMNDVVLDAATGLPRLALARLPTPYEPAPRLAAALGVRSLAVKREDLSGYALGGNKLRQLDFILAEALAAGADTVIATAASQSNFCRSLAGAAAKAGLACRLHLRAATGTEPVGNLLLDRILGAEVSFTSATDPWDPSIAAQLAAIADELRAAGRRPFVVQLTGASAATAAIGWFAAAPELLRDFAAGERPAAAVVACGSGLTLAGLALGLKHCGGRARLFGVSAQQPASRLVPWIVETADIAARRLGIATRLGERDFDLVDRQIAPGYGLPSPASVAAVKLAGRTEALLLDPIYTGKALAGLSSALDEGMIDRASAVAFIHSGGAPGIFVHGADLAR